MHGVVKAAKWQILQAAAAAPPPVATTDQCLTAALNTGFLQYWNACGQTFQPDHNYDLVGLSLRLNQYKTTRKGPFIVKVTQTGGNCWQETILWSEAGWSLDLPVPGSTDWTYYTIPGISLNSSTVYRIVVHTTPGWYYWNGSEWVLEESYAALQWWRNTVDCYARGQYCSGCDFKTPGASWTLHSGDMDFICYE
jgi:hypothetical protein